MAALDSQSFKSTEYTPAQAYIIKRQQIKIRVNFIKIWQRIRVIRSKAFRADQFCLREPTLSLPHCVSLYLIQLSLCFLIWDMGMIKNTIS